MNRDSLYRDMGTKQGMLNSNKKECQKEHLNFPPSTQSPYSDSRVVLKPTNKISMGDDLVFQHSQQTRFSSQVTSSVIGIRSLSRFSYNLSPRCIPSTISLTIFSLSFHLSSRARWGMDGRKFASSLTFAKALSSRSL